MKDDKNITAIFLTLNRFPKAWEDYHKAVLLKELNGKPLITISRVPMDISGINIIQEEKPSMSNIYWQLLRGAKLAKTDYIAVVEDDSLYPAEHFTFKPLKKGIGYNMCKWSLFTWGEPIYSWRNRRGNYTMIGKRDLVIECLEERYKRYPNGTPDDRTGEIGRHMVERNLGITLRDVEEFMTTVPIINFNHDLAFDTLQLNHRKRHGLLRAYDVPYWGKAKELLKKFIV